MPLLRSFINYKANKAFIEKKSTNQWIYLTLPSWDFWHHATRHEELRGYNLSLVGVCFKYLIPHLVLKQIINKLQSKIYPTENWSAQEHQGGWGKMGLGFMWAGATEWGPVSSEETSQKQKQTRETEFPHSQTYTLFLKSRRTHWYWRSYREWTKSGSRWPQALDQKGPPIH